MVLSIKIWNSRHSHKQGSQYFDVLGPELLIFTSPNKDMGWFLNGTENICACQMVYTSCPLVKICSNCAIWYLLITLKFVRVIWNIWKVTFTYEILQVEIVK